MTSHYDTIGVPPDASAGDIKKAYRKRASKAHPDRGGDGEKMAAVNKAYEVLIDPRRREAYDKLGEDDPIQATQSEAERMVCSIFAAALEKDVPSVLVAARDMLRMHRGQAISAKSAAEQKRKSMAKRRAKLRTKDGVRNLVHMLIDDALTRLNAEIANCEEQLALNAMAAAIVDGYESDEEIQIEVPHFRGLAQFTFKDMTP